MELRQDFRSNFLDDFPRRTYRRQIQAHVMRAAIAHVLQQLRKRMTAAPVAERDLLRALMRIIAQVEAHRFCAERAEFT